jgi:hypothetical protein
MTCRKAEASVLAAARSFSRCLDQAAIRLVITALLLPFGAGCVPDAVIWLPDSSGVIYTDKDGARLNHYDLGKKATRVICADTGTRTPWPAVSPDGSRVAVCRVVTIQPPNSKTETTESQIIIYALDGTEVHRSRIHQAQEPSEANAKAGETLEEAALIWPTNDAVFSLSPPELHYQISKERFKRLRLGDDPIPMPYGASPDGEAFLGLFFKKSPSDGAWLAFVDKDGWIERSDQIFSSKDDRFPARWHWSGPVATGVHRKKSVQIDTRDMSVTETDRQLESPIPNAEVVFAHDFPAKKTRLYACNLEDADGKKTGILELHSLENKKFRQLGIKAWGFDGVFDLFLSPCDRFVAARIPIDGEDRILIYDGGIEPVADIRCEK